MNDANLLSLENMPTIFRADFCGAFKHLLKFNNMELSYSDEMFCKNYIFFRIKIKGYLLRYIIRYSENIYISPTFYHILFNVGHFGILCVCVWVYGQLWVQTMIIIKNCPFDILFYIGQLIKDKSIYSAITVCFLSTARNHWIGRAIHVELLDNFYSFVWLPFIPFFNFPFLQDFDFYSVFRLSQGKRIQLSC